MYINKREKFEEAMDGLKDVITEAVSEDIETMDAQTLEAIQAMIRFIRASKEIVIAQERALKSIDDKLNKILEKMDAN